MCIPKNLAVFYSIKISPPIIKVGALLSRAIQWMVLNRQEVGWMMLYRRVMVDSVG